MVTSPPGIWNKMDIECRRSHSARATDTTVSQRLQLVAFALLLVVTCHSLAAQAEELEQQGHSKPKSHPGRCPGLIDSDPQYCSTNVSECKIDSDCHGSEKCCSDGCVLVCTEPLYSACEHQRMATESRARMLGSSFSERRPRCRTDGEFEPIQCDEFAKECWCSDRAGFELAGTRAASRELVNCSAPRPCAGLMCRMLCPYDFELDDDGCPLCQCRDPCSGIGCPGGQKCHLEEVVCNSEPCPPLPSCREARLLTSICPAGEPLTLSEGSQPFLCGLDANKPQCPPFFTCVVEDKMEYGACCPSLDQIEKPGKCPQNTSDLTECGDHCQTDSDCIGLLKCCNSDRCGSRCIASNNTVCEQQHHLAELLSRNELGDKGYVPECTNDGEFKSKQCSRNGLVCWCVDKNGNKRPRSMGPAVNVTCAPTSETNVISASAECDPVICNSFCEYGFKLDSVGCPTCECSDACDGFACPENQRCVVDHSEACIESFCVSVPKCEDMPQRSRKTGICVPTLPLHEYKCINETVYCYNNDDCGTGHHCCTRLCGPSCSDPLELMDRLPTMCEYLRDYALSMAASDTSDNLAFPPPKCMRDGLFEPVQCNDVGECWCVDDFGAELRKTRAASREKVDCRAAQGRTSCLGLMCRLGCDYGFVRDEHGCPVCECRNPCENAVCKEGTQCQLVEVNMPCKGGFCPPVPQCVSASRNSNACPIGEPLVDSEANSTWICGIGNKMCPENYYCVTEDSSNEGICCSKLSVDVCNLPNEFGSCDDRTIRWFYNKGTIRCESFIYSGCHGNLNNFNSQIECEKTCVVNRNMAPKDGSCPAVRPNEMGSCAEECSRDADCTGPQKCCLNGCGAHVCRDPAGSTGKAGQCPFLGLHALQSCDFQCTSDYGCPDDNKCCSNGCGTTCMTAELKTACEHQKSIAEFHVKELRFNAASTFVPQCRDDDGGFKSVQCHSGYCWCVGEDGMELPGTRTRRGMPISCDASSQICPSVECDMECDHGIQLDEKGCLTCFCRDPCEGVMCNPGEQCRMVQLNCVSQPCLPAPVCLPQSDNPCSHGEPLRDVLNKKVLTCGPQGYQCPSTHKCNLSPLAEYAICCPKPRDVCVQSKDRGHCLGAIPRWYFDPGQNGCQEFAYGGCGGNLNNFQTKEDCHSVCPVLSTCERVRERNIQIMTFYNKNMFLPKCNKATGAWEPVQCLPHLGLCWCVNRDGEQKAGTLVRGVPQCTARMGRMFSNTNQICSENVVVHACTSSICDDKVCLAYPKAICRVDPCGGCAPRFYDELNNAVDCDKGLTTCQRDLQLVLNSDAWANQRNTLSVRRLEDLEHLGIVEPMPAGGSYEGGQTVVLVKNVVKRDVVDKTLSMLKDFLPGIEMARSMMRAFFQPEVIKPGMCPVPKVRDMLRELSRSMDHPMECSQSCMLDSDCSDDQKCCMTWCGLSCLAPTTPAWATKPGKCPAISDDLPSLPHLLECLNVAACQLDSDCLGDSKCCQTQCGSACINITGDLASAEERADASETSTEMIISSNTANSSSKPITWLRAVATTTTAPAMLELVEPVFMSAVLPRCLVDGSYSSTQRNGDLSWCISPDGKAVANSLKRGELECSYSGEVSIYQDAPPVCPDGIPQVCKNQCVNAFCPANPDAICKADPCHDCATTFYNEDGEAVSCEEKCAQPLEVGICRASFNRYFYNKTSQECEEFIYGGCRGNGNNFESIEECEVECKQPVNVCKQPKKIGMCRASMRRWFYNQKSRKCEQFSYGGCNGNDNNFETEEECDARCPDLVLCLRLDLQSDMTPCSRSKACNGAVCPGPEEAVCTVDPCNNCSVIFVDYDGNLVQCNNTIAEGESSTVGTETSTAHEVIIENDVNARTVVPPQMISKTRCEKQRVVAAGQRLRLPSCDSLGRFKPTQCEDKLCWCVDEAGNQLDGFPRFEEGSQICRLVKVSRVNVNLAFEHNGDMSQNTEQIKQAVGDILNSENAEMLNEIDVHIAPEAVYAQFILSGDNKVDVAYSLEEKSKYGDLFIIVDGQNLRVMHSASSFRHEIDSTNSAYPVKTVALIVGIPICLLCCLFMIITTCRLWKRSKMGSYPKGSLESLASSTSPLYSATECKKAPSPELSNLKNDELENSEFDISCIEHEYAVITSKPCNKKEQNPYV